MKTLAYLDCPTGISGDMCLGALVDAGVPLGYLERQLALLNIKDEFQLSAESVVRNQQAATKVSVKLRSRSGRSDSHSHDHDVPGGRRLPEIEALIQQANLPERAAAWSLAVFRRLAEAEAAVHGIAPQQVHFHEVGATDAIVDIVGTCLGLDWLKVDALICSPLPTGGGTVRCEHGLLPVPAPAVLNMMATAHIPVYGNGIERELVTPTGCAIAATLAQSFGPPPQFTLQKIGLGAGSQNFALPNILRLWIGTAAADTGLSGLSSLSGLSGLSGLSMEASTAHAHPIPAASRHEAPETEPIVELQTQLDDISPQAIAYVFEQLLAQGALDVFTQPVLMKKSRLGTLLTVLCLEPVVAKCEALLFRETTTLGIRQTRQVRSRLAREIMSVTTAYGEIAVKVARSQQGGPLLNVQPEYEDCAGIARAQNIPWQQVHQAAMDAAWLRLRSATG
jgi:pyridinium-3,5-bisthiocarboxylic acid mononucleotide nickel chelatase